MGNQPAQPLTKEEEYEEWNADIDATIAQAKEDAAKFLSDPETKKCIQEAKEDAAKLLSNPKFHKEVEELKAKQDKVIKEERTKQARRKRKKQNMKKDELIPVEVNEHFLKKNMNNFSLTFEKDTLFKIYHAIPISKYHWGLLLVNKYYGNIFVHMDVCKTLKYNRKIEITSSGTTLFNKFNYIDCGKYYFKDIEEMKVLFKINNALYSSDVDVDWAIICQGFVEVALKSMGLKLQKLKDTDRSKYAVGHFIPGYNLYAIYQNSVDTIYYNWGLGTQKYDVDLIESIKDYHNRLAPFKNTSRYYFEVKCIWNENKNR